MDKGLINQILKNQELALNQKDFATYERYLLSTDSNRNELHFLKNEIVAKETTFYFDVDQFFHRDGMYPGWIFVYMNQGSNWIGNLLFSVFVEEDDKLKKIFGNLQAQVGSVKMKELDGETRFDFARGFVSVKCTVTFEILAVEVEYIIFRLNHGLRVKRIQLDQSDVDFGPIDEGNNGIFVALPKVYRKSEVIALQIEYEGEPLLRFPNAFSEKGSLLWSEANIYPTLNFFPRDKYKSQMIFYHDQGYAVCSNGTFKEEYNGEGLTVTKWSSDTPLVGITFYIGQLEKKVFYQDDLSITIYYTMDSDFQCESLANHLFEIILFYKTLFDMIPYKDIVVCYDPDMDICCTNSNLLYLYSDSPLVLAHEAAHLWWGSYVTASGPGWLWFHESFASIFCYKYLDQRTPGIYEWRTTERTFRDKEVSLGEEILQMTFFGNTSAIYDVGLVVLHQVIEQLGYEQFLHICRQILHDCAFGEITLNQFNDYCRGIIPLDKI